MMSEWVSVEKRKPEEGQKVLLLVVYQRMPGGVYCEDEIMITGGIEDGEWFVGDQMLMWDFGHNLDFVEEDVTHWMPLPEPPKGDL